MLFRLLARAHFRYDAVHRKYRTNAANESSPFKHGTNGAPMRAVLEGISNLQPIAALFGGTEPMKTHHSIVERTDGSPMGTRTKL